jgi:hypothetical protein
VIQGLYRHPPSNPKFQHFTFYEIFARFRQDLVKFEIFGGSRLRACAK